MKVPDFKTAEVAELFQQVQSWCHPEYPFQDPLYSAGSRAAAIDYTQIVAGWLAAGASDAISEFWSFLTPENSSSSHLLKKGLDADVPDWIHCEDWQRHELRAIYLLSLRCALVQPGKATAYVAMRLGGTTLACQPVNFDEARLSELLWATRSEIVADSVWDPCGNREASARLSLGRVQSAIGTEANAVEPLKGLPPMARAVIREYFRWGVAGKLNFNLGYDDRMYGCCGKLNEYYLGTLNFFEPPGDEAPIPSRVTKDLLVANLVAENIPHKRSESRAELVHKARQRSGLVSRLILQACPEQQVLRAEWMAPVAAWAERAGAVEAAAAGIIKLMARL